MGEVHLPLGPYIRPRRRGLQSLYTGPCPQEKAPCSREDVGGAYLSVFLYLSLSRSLSLSLARLLPPSLWLSLSPSLSLHLCLALSLALSLPSSLPPPVSPSLSPSSSLFIWTCLPPSLPPSLSLHLPLSSSGRGGVHRHVGDARLIPPSSLLLRLPSLYLFLSLSIPPFLGFFLHPSLSPSLVIWPCADKLVRPASSPAHAECRRPAQGSNNVAHSIQIAGGKGDFPAQVSLQNPKSGRAPSRW